VITTTGPVNLDGASEQEAVEEEVPLTRSEAVTSFIASPILPEPNQLRIDQISTFVAFAAAYNGEVQKKAIKLLSMEYDKAAAYLIWHAWAPHISPPVGHPLAGGTKAKDLVMATLLKPFPTATLAKAAAAALIDALAAVITT
jgi:hypothetical protein